MTNRDKDILVFIKNYMVDYGVTPTIREIGEGVGLYSTSSVHKHMQKLVTEGKITPVSNSSYRYTVKGMKYVEDNGN